MSTMCGRRVWRGEDELVFDKKQMFQRAADSEVCLINMKIRQEKRSKTQQLFQ